MTRLVLVVSLMLCICVSFAQIYKWTDAQGNVHFTDTPHEGAEQVKIPESQTYTAPKLKSPTGVADNEDKDSKPRTYTKVEITQPDNEATVRNNQGYVVVAVQLEPELTPGDNLQMVFDGSPLGEPQPELTFQLNGIYRGTHTIAIQVLNPSGEALATSNSVTFHMHRPRVGGPAHGGIGGGGG